METKAYVEAANLLIMPKLYQESVMFATVTSNPDVVRIAEWLERQIGY